MFLKYFMCTVYKPFHDECLKNISSITFISLAIFKNAEKTSYFISI